MPTIRGSDFEILLPGECSDESTYSFALPSRLSFRPSVVVRTDRLIRQVQLSTYVAHQVEKIRTQVEDLVVVSSSPAEHGTYTAYAVVCDWGEASRRIRQMQRYILLPDPARVVTLTATSLGETFAEAEALFQAIFLSFRPVK